MIFFKNKNKIIKDMKKQIEEMNKNQIYLYYQNKFYKNEMEKLRKENNILKQEKLYNKKY